jgi:glycosyltransferase involved in cell wall biosynthesis
VSRIAFAAYGFPFTIDYPEARPIMLARDLGHEVHTIGLPQPGRPVFEGVQMWTETSVPALGRRIRNVRPDLLFLERPGRLTPLALLARRCWVRALEHAKSAPAQAVRSAAARRITAFTFTNPWEERRWPRAHARVRDLPYPVATTWWRSPVARDPALWTDRGWPVPQGRVVVSVANLLRRKQHAEIVEWGAAVLRDDPALRLCIVGNAYEPDEEARIRAAAAEAGVVDQVLLTGHLGAAEVRALFAWADVHVVNSRYETQCMALYEGLCAGVPTLLFNNPVLTSAFPELPVHRDRLSFDRNLREALDQGRAAWSLTPDGERRLDWSDVERHDGLLRLHLEELLA